MQKEESAPAEEPVRPRQMFRLKLDHDDIYFGCEAIPEGEEPKADDVLLDHAPDNPPGQYRWMRAQKRLEALPKERQKTEPGAPTLEQAFYEMVGAAIDEGALKVPLPPRITAWLVWFEKSIDGKGMVQVV